MRKLLLYLLPVAMTVGVLSFVALVTGLIGGHYDTIKGSFELLFLGSMGYVLFYAIFIKVLEP